jgi:hypothetical protein
MKAIYPIRRDRLGIQYRAVRPVCWLCKAPLDNSARLQGRIYCTDCACGRVIRDVLRPSALRRRSPLLKGLGRLGFALLCAAAMVALYGAAHLLERGL